MQPRNFGELPETLRRYNIYMYITIIHIIKIIIKIYIYILSFCKIQSLFMIKKKKTSQQTNNRREHP